MHGHRGARGELTVKVPGGPADDWLAVRTVWIGPESGEAHPYEVESSRAYRDRLVLKLRGIDDGNSAERLRGQRVSVLESDAPTPPQGSYHREQLVGLTLVDQEGRCVGTVTDVVPTAGADLLVVDRGSATGTVECLVPFVRDFLMELDPAAGRLQMRLPAGLTDLAE